MTNLEIAQHIANIHNRLVQISVNGEGAILMGDTLKELRFLVQEIQKNVDAEEASEDKQAEVK